MFKHIAATLLLISATSAVSQEMRDTVTPAVGAPATATVGSTVYQRDHYRVLPAYTIAEPVVAKIVLARVNLPADTRLLRIESKTKLKACAVASIEDYRNKLYQGCLMDDDGNGTFDRVAGNEIQGGRKLDHPVAYKNSEFIEPSPDSVKQVVIFLGSTKDTLRLSYREFVNDMARPAFTEEYTFPLSATYPQPVAFKDVKLTVTGIDGAGLHYILK